MNDIKISAYSLKKLKRKFKSREFAIPEIQRQFVWNKTRVCNLMDSIYHNYPIGISLVWNAPFSKAIDVRPNNKTIIYPFNKRLKHTDLIIDGQQRLTTLFGAIFGVQINHEANSFIDYRQLFFICDKKIEKRFVFSKKWDSETKGVVSLYDIINMPLSQLQRSKYLTQQEFKELKKCSYAFSSYKFFILNFKAASFEDVKQIFIRINSAGMTVNRADTLFARASQVNLRHHISDTKRGLKNGFSEVSDDAIQNTLALAYGASRIGGQGFQQFLRSIEKNKNMENKEFSKKWTDLQYGYEEAVDFLINHIKISNFKLLPSQNIYSMLSFFFYLNKSRAKPHQIKELKKWFWLTSCGDRYSGRGFNKNIPEDIKFLKKLAEGTNIKFSTSNKVNPVDFLKINYKNSRSSAGNAYYILLRTKKPRYMSNGYEMLLDNPSSISNRKDRHHIFPSALLTRSKININWANSIANICFITSDENQSFQDKHPRKYLLEFKRKKHFKRVLQTHLIPNSSTGPLWNGNVKQSFLEFINLRGKLILKEIESQAGTKIFETFDGIRRV